MEKEPMPPSYNDVMATTNPSAPMMMGESPAHYSQGPQPGWNPHMNNQHPQHPVVAQPHLVHQPMLQQHHMSHQQAAPVGAQQTIIIVNNQPLDRLPMTMMCPHCLKQIVTRLQYQNSCTTHVMAGLCCLLGWWPCALIPYCTTCLKDVTHHCPSCNSYLGIYRASSRRRY